MILWVFAIVFVRTIHQSYKLNFCSDISNSQWAERRVCFIPTNF